MTTCIVQEHSDMASFVTAQCGTYDAAEVGGAAAPSAAAKHVWVLPDVERHARSVLAHLWDVVATAL